jgi:site-specific DNA-adenine methylase
MITVAPPQKNPLRWNKLRPMIPYYGSKWMLAPRYPDPKYGTIIEPCCGGAGYSLRYPTSRVQLYDINPTIVGIWSYLIVVSEAEINHLPDRVQTLRDLPTWICQEARDLIGFWLNPGSSQPKNKIGTWSSPLCDTDIRYWSPRIKERIIQQLPYIRHWTVSHLDFRAIPVEPERSVWFIDPPYKGRQGSHYMHPMNDGDYEDMADWIHTLPGQIIVCETIGATWLPFVPFAVGRSGKYHLGGEAIYYVNQ